MLLPALLLTACLPASRGTDEACRAGFSRAGDGHCYPPPPDPEAPSVTDVIDGMTCESLDPDGLVEIDDGCVEGACALDTFAEVDAALGGEAACGTASWSNDWVYCSWPQLVEGLFPDADHDAIGDPDGRTDWLHLQQGYAHATEDGLGVGISPRCWVDVLGVPSSAYWVDAAGVLALQDVYWTSYGAEVHDWDGPDGLVDDVYLFGAP